MHVQSADRASMVTKFESVMQRMAVIGFSPSDLIDCSEVIPTPPSSDIQVAHLPAGMTMDDIDQSCPGVPFPSLTADSGPETTIPPV